MANSALTVRDVAERYAVHAQNVLAWIRNGELRAIDVSKQPGCGRPRWRIMADALVEFEEKRRPKPPNKQKRRRQRSATRPGFIRYFSSEGRASTCNSNQKE